MLHKNAESESPLQENHFIAGLIYASYTDFADLLWEGEMMSTNLSCGGDELGNLIQAVQVRN